MPLRATQIAAVAALTAVCLSSALAQRRTEEVALPADPADGNRATLVWGGSQRTRYSSLHNQFRPGLSGDDDVLSLQTLVDATVSFGGLRFTGEVEDARAYLTDRSSAVSPIIVNAGAVLQAHIGLDFTTKRGDVALTIGRFTMDLGSRRLIARQTFRNSITNFTGARVEWSTGGGDRLTFFSAMPVLIRPTDLDGLLDNRIERDYQGPDLRFTGLHYAAGAGPRLRGEVFAYELDERDDPGERQTADRALTTLGLRLRTAPARGRWDFEIESIWQTGHRRATSRPEDTLNLDVDARFVHASAGFTFDRPWSPRLDIEYDFGSGNEGDGGWQRFDSLFGPRRADLGPTGIYGPLGRENIESTGLRLTVAPGDRLDAYIVYRVNRLDEPGDTFARTGVQDPSGAAGRDAGGQLEVRTRYWISPGRIRLEFGAARFANGRFLETAPNATHEGDTAFWYSDLTYRFGRRGN